MKLTTVLNSHKSDHGLDVVTEGIRFGQREINQVKKEAKDIFIGFEYEFNMVADKINAYIEKNHPEDIIDTSDIDTDDLDIDDFEQESIHSVYESSIYEEARYRAEQKEWNLVRNDVIANEIAAIKDRFDNERENELIMYSDLHELFLHYAWNDHKDIIQWVDNFVEDGGYKQFQDIIDDLNTDREISEEELVMFFRIVNRLNKFQDIFTQNDTLFDTFTTLTDLEPLYGEMRGVELPPKDKAEMEYYEFSQAETLESVVEAIGQVDLQSYEDFDTKDQQAFIFDTNYEEAKKIAQSFEDVGVEEDTWGIFTGYLLTINTEETDGEHFGKAYSQQYFKDNEEGIMQEAYEHYMQNTNDWERHMDFDEIVQQYQMENNVVVMQDGGDPFLRDWYDYLPQLVGSRYVASQAFGSIRLSSAVQFIKEYGKDWGISMNDFSNYNNEGSGMIEFASKPLPMMKAFDLMDRMFDMIRTIGTTHHGGAGLHTNMSIKNVKFNKEEFDPVKLLMFVDHETTKLLFPVRTHVSDIFDGVGTKALFELAQLPDRRFMEGFKKFIKTDHKLQSINYKHINLHGDERRIEFRYTGGEDYEMRSKTIKWQVARFAFALMAAFDDDFMQKEYYREIIKTLDNLVRTKVKVREFKYFLELRDVIKKNRKIMDYDSFLDWIADERLATNKRRR